MSTFKTSLKIMAAHRSYVLVYLVALSLLGLNVGAARTEDASSQVKEATTSVAVIDRDGSTISRGTTSSPPARLSRWRTPDRPFKTPPRRTGSATSSSFRPDTANSSSRRLVRGLSHLEWTQSSGTSRHPAHS